MICERLSETASLPRRYWACTNILTISTFGSEGWLKSSFQAPGRGRCSPAWSDGRWRPSVMVTGKTTRLKLLLHVGEGRVWWRCCFLRFWWEAEGVFTKQQKAALLKSSLSRIICDNTGVNELLPDSFTFRKYPSGYTSCDHLPSVNLEAWKEEQSQGGLEKSQHGQFVHSLKITTLFNSRFKVLWQPGDGRQRRFYFVLYVWQTGRSLLLLPWFPVKGSSCNSLRGDSMERSAPPVWT